jgi:hypothetical protein
MKMGDAEPEVDTEMKPAQNVNVFLKGFINNHRITENLTDYLTVLLQ